ncbi:MAG: hypothetical protein KIS63_04265 [Caldilineales bacterium]|nr:hypothetical protein [Caldilineales bacterium]
MSLEQLLADIHALEEDLLSFERRYGVRSETFYAGYQSGEEAEDDAWMLDFGEWASVYRTYLVRQALTDPYLLLGSESAGSVAL